MYEVKRISLEDLGLRDSIKGVRHFSKEIANHVGSPTQLEELKYARKSLRLHVAYLVCSRLLVFQLALISAHYLYRWLS